MPRAINMMRRREEEILKALLHLSERTKEFTNPELIMTGGYALRVFIPLSRFTRDCDFALRKKNGWNINELKRILPDDYSIEEEEKRDSYGFLCMHAWPSTSSLRRNGLNRNSLTKKASSTKS